MVHIQSQIRDTKNIYIAFLFPVRMDCLRVVLLATSFKGLKLVLHFERGSLKLRRVLRRIILTRVLTFSKVYYVVSVQGSLFVIAGSYFSKHCCWLDLMLAELYIC